MTDERLSPRIYIEKEDRPLFQDIREKINKKLPKKDNIDNTKLFTITVLIGKYILKKREPLISRTDMVRFQETKNKQLKNDRIVLQCVAISENDDISLAYDEEDETVGKMLRICEEYAKPGLHELNNWINSKDMDLETKLSDILTEKTKEIEN